MGEAVEASSTAVEMEAAEQLIQLSGGGCNDGGDSESRSADSVRAGDGEGEKRTAVESKGAEGVSGVMAGEKRGDGEEAAPVPAVESGTGKRREKIGVGAAKGGGGEAEEAVIGGVARRRPRFRSLAAIYRETRRMDENHHGHCRDEAQEKDKGDGEGKEKKKKRTTDGAADGEAVPSAAPCKAKRAVRRRTS